MSTVNARAESLHTQVSDLDVLYVRYRDTPVAGFILDRIGKLRDRAYGLEAAGTQEGTK